MDRLFLDANVLYSAAYLSSSSFRALWELTDVELVTSAYAAAEARDNLHADHPERLGELGRLLSLMGITGDPPTMALPAGVLLAEKDRPILAAAIEAGATHLLTGDVKHFGQFFGQSIAGVLIVRPADYLRERGQSPSS